MVSQLEQEYPLEEGSPEPDPTQLEPQCFEAIRVLETVKYQIVELQSFKAENEQLKRAQEKQYELNEILLQSLQEWNNGEKPPA